MFVIFINISSILIYDVFFVLNNDEDKWHVFANIFLREDILEIPNVYLKKPYNCVFKRSTSVERYQNLPTVVCKTMTKITYV